MNIYFVDKQWLGTETVAIEKKAFEGAGHTISFMSWKTEEEVIAGAADADAIMVVAVPISKRAMDAMPNLKFIGRCGIGYDSVDIEEAAKRGIVVCNVPDYCSYEVASHSFALLLVLKRNLVPFMKRAKEGEYGQGSQYQCYRLKGQTLGLLGYGRIARNLAAMAKGAGMKIAVYDPFVQALEDENTVLLRSLDELFQISDAISIHTPLTPETKRMVNEQKLKLMKKTAVIINTSRGPVIDTQALVKALNAGWIAGAGLDVCEGEPLPADAPVLSAKNLIMTPHVAMYSEEAMIELHKKLTKQALDVLSGHWTENVVNPKVQEVKSFLP